jgi:H+/Cl- antiporter ClcA
MVEGLREAGRLAGWWIGWTSLSSAVGALCGLASAAFLYGLYWATELRESHPGWLWGLPLAGLLIYWLYARLGQQAAGGNNLLLERIQAPTGDVTWRMAPLIAITTIITHLFGGSAGREGTAVQMGGSLANLFSNPLRLSGEQRRVLLMSGVSGGFGAVFGTPLAGTLFGLEVAAVGRLRYEGLVPCLVASIVGDRVCRLVGPEHHHYHLSDVPDISLGLLALVVLAGLVFGWVSRCFAETTRWVERTGQRWLPMAWLRPVVGGIVVIGLVQIVNDRDYLGLSLPLIDAAFEPVGSIWVWGFALKLLFTAVTLGSGFKGGEVTPLFCIGAMLGHSFASLTGQSTSLFAALGFVAVFAGAANTPLACLVMGIELFGESLAVPLAVACIASYGVSGHRGIYLAQVVEVPKAGARYLERAGIEP